MDIEENRDFDDFAQANADRWRRIANQSAVATIFQTWEWTEAWWRHFGAGKRLWALRFVDDGETVGYGALFLRDRPALVRTVRFLGTGLSDYSDLIAAPGREDAVANAFGAWLGETRGRWDRIALQQVPTGSVAARLLPVVSAGQARSSGSGVRVRSSCGKICMYIQLAPSWAAFQRSLSSKMRETVMSRIRVVERRHGGAFRLADRQSLPVDLDALFDLHQRRWNAEGAPGLLASERFRAFHRSVSSAFLAAGMLRLHVLSLEGRPRAVSYSFQKGAVRYGSVIGYDPAFSNLSLGTVVAAQTIRDAIEADHAAELDLAQGEEAYKRRWGGQDRPTLRLSLTHRGVRSAGAGLAIGALEEAVEKQLFPQLMRAGFRPRRLAYRVRRMFLRAAPADPPSGRPS